MGEQQGPGGAGPGRARVKAPGAPLSSVRVGADGTPVHVTGRGTEWSASLVTRALVLGGGAMTPEENAYVRSAWGVTLFVSAAAELGAAELNVPEHVPFLHLAWEDDGAVKPVTDFVRVTRWLREEGARQSAMAGVAPVAYIGCFRGVNRGPLLATAVAAILTGVEPDEAWARVKARRPAASGYEAIPAYHASAVAAYRYCYRSGPGGGRAQ